MATATQRGPSGNGAATKSRMTLDAIQRKTEPQPDRILLVGTEGIGKTTFAAESPSPVFLCAEDGIPVILGDVPRFPVPESVADVLDAVRTLIREEHDFRTFVIDTVDWLEPIVWRDLCARNDWKDIEAPGYGKGYVAATEEWRKILAALDILRKRKGMEVILLAHAAIRTFQNPAGNDFSRYECKLNKGAAALLREWCDVNLFAIHEEFAEVKAGKPTRKGISTGRRVIHTERTAAWDAKNRYALPAELPLNYADYAQARAAAQPADPTELWEEGQGLINELAIDDEKKNQTREWLDDARAGGAAALARAVDRLRSKVAEMGGV